MPKIRPLRTAALVSGALLVLTAATCSPPPSTTPVPSIYPPCVGSPTCLVETGALISSAAISDDGRIMATLRLHAVGDGFESTVGLVGIDDRWYRQVDVVEEPLGVSPLVMTPDAEVLVFATSAGGPIGPDAVLHVYRRSTASLTTISDPGRWTPIEVSDDGRYLLANEEVTNGLWRFDLVAGTSELVAPHVCCAAMSGDGRYVLWNEGGTAVRHDLSDDSTVALPDWTHGTPMLSGDGSRAADSGGDADQPDIAGFRVIDVGAPSWTQLSSDPVLYATRLSRDGSHLIGMAGTDGIVDWDVDARTKRVIAPLSLPLAISPNGNHVLYTPTNDPTTVLRWNR